MVLDRKVGIHSFVRTCRPSIFSYPGTYFPIRECYISGTDTAWYWCWSVWKCIWGATEMQPRFFKRLQRYSASFGQNSSLFGRGMDNSCARIGWFSQTAQLVCNEMQRYDHDDNDAYGDDHDHEDDCIGDFSMQSGVWWWMDNNELGMRLPLYFIIIIKAKIIKTIIIFFFFLLTDGGIDASDQTAPPKPRGHFEKALPLTEQQKEPNYPLRCLEVLAILHI